jgi:DNA-binding NtrC family response regulator
MPEDPQHIALDAPPGEPLDALREELGAQGWLLDDAPSAGCLCVVSFDDAGGRLFETLRKLESDPTPIIGVVQRGDVTAAVEAMRLGATTVVQRGPYGVSVDDVVDAIDSYVMRPGPQERDPLVEFVRAKGSPLDPILEILPQLARSDAPVLLLGESGTGKDMLAEALHALGPRRRGPFVAVNCGAIPVDLLESELFGHVKGAFTGAIADRAGQFEAANGGTVFLDEIGEVPSHVQVKLLRVLQDKTITRVGSTSPRAIDFRVVAATHRDLDAELARGAFREDLYYRLSVLPVHVPPLRERPMDILPLAEHFFAAHGAIDAMEPEVRAALRRYSWPGNVRELENLAERVSVLKGGGTVTPDDLPPSIRDAPPQPIFGLDVPSEGIDMAQTLENLEERLLTRALDKAAGNKARAARLLGLNRTTFVEKLKRRRIDYDG